MTKKLEQKTYLTTETRWLSALDTIQKAGVLVFDNFPTCCRSCAFSEIEQAHPGTDHISFINSQGHGLKFIDGEPFNFEKEYIEDYDDDEAEPEEYEITTHASKVYWTQSTLEAARAAEEAFREQGFVVDWDGTEGRSVTVVFS